MQPKIVTCCYCGTRAALVLTGEVRHELACSACGAPLHDLKALKKTENLQKERRRDVRRGYAPSRPAHPRAAVTKKRPRKRKSLARKILSEAVDLIEDIFD